MKQKSPIYILKRLLLKMIGYFNNIKNGNDIIMNNKPNVLIISSNFKGGGLETRINNIVNRFSHKYNFSLITRTPIEDMKTKPSQYITKIYKWKEYKRAIKNADIIDIHPWKISKIYKKWKIFANKNITKIYTIHGELSLCEDLHFLQYCNRVYCVGNSLINKTKSYYPNVKNIYLSKNYAEIIDNDSFDIKDKNILFSITNTSDINYLQEIINNISEDYTIHIIGCVDNTIISRENGILIIHGFVNLTAFLNQYKFIAAFSRGGFATQDIVARNVPVFLISSNEDGFYFEGLTKTNFIYLSDNNFVTRKPFNKKHCINQLKNINTDYENYQCSNLLKCYNNISLMHDPYDF